jgi:hypothetical protein
MINSDLRSVTAYWVKYLLVLMTPLYFARVASFIPFFNYPLSLKYVKKSRCIRDMSIYLIAIIANFRSQV